MYDFIIVGAGPSGITLAYRLATSTPHAKVLLLEAGTDKVEADKGLLTDRWDAFIKYPQRNWGYKTVPQPHLDGRTLDLAQGRGLGGGTLINFCCWTVGPKDDYERMAAEVGDEAFGWENLIRMRKKFENSGDPVPAEYSEYLRPIKDVHGYEGKVSAQWPQIWEEPILDQIDAVKECGLGVCTDVNGGNPLGAGHVPSSVKDGKRFGADLAYLGGKRPENLEIICESPVRRVLLEGKKAVGMECRGMIYHASKEVILSAGAIATPKLLMLSGIGPAEHLAKYNIPVIQDLPGVGQNLQDHYFARHLWRARDGYNTFKQHSLPTPPDKPLAGLNETISMGFYKADEVKETPAYAELDASVKQHLDRPTIPIWETSLLVPPWHPNMDPQKDYLTAAIILMNP